MINEVYLHISSHDKAMQLSEAIETNACGSMFVTHKKQEELKKETDIFNYINIYNPQIQISAESETKRSIFREKDKTKRSKKESAQHSKSRNKSFVMTSVSAL